LKDIVLEEKYILEYIREMINDFKVKSIEVNNIRYHHNSSYSEAPSILKHGILSLSELNRLGIRNYSSEFLRTMNDTDSHINGNDAISLSVVGLTDLSKDEFEYNPYYPTKVDFIVSSDVRAHRSSIHYGNEYICYDNIGIDKLMSVDVRLFDLIKITTPATTIKDIIDKYNSLKGIALAIKQSQLNIPFREMSNGNLTMDVDKVSKTPKLILK